MFSVNPKGNSLPNHSRTPSNSIPNKRTSGPEHKRSGSSALGFLFPSHTKGASSGAKAEQPPSGVPVESAAEVVAAQTASVVIPTGQEPHGIFSSGRMKPHHLEEGLAGVDASDRQPSIKYPETPPLLGRTSRRASLINARNSKGDPPDTKSESDLMIGEIKVNKRVYVRGSIFVAILSAPGCEKQGATGVMPRRGKVTPKASSRSIQPH